MKRSYKSKVDIWLLLLIDAVVMLSLLPIMCWGDEALLLSMGIAILSMAFTTYVFFSIDYTIEEDYLCVRCAFFLKTRICIQDIRVITSTRTFLSAPAASLDRIEIKFQKGSIIISPKHKEEFIADLCAINEQIIVL